MEFVLSRKVGGTGWITLNRPGKINALSTELVSRLSSALLSFEHDDEIRVIVVEGAGGNFSVGYDIAEEIELGISRAEDWHTSISRNVAVSMALWSCSKPTIASVDGWCLAGGCELAMACDLIISSENAKFGEPEIRFGSGPVTLLMPFILGQKKTMELLLTGDVVSASEAERIGLVNRVVPVDQLQTTVQELATRISLTPLVTLRYTKLALTRAYEAMGLRNAVNSNLDIAATLNAAEAEDKAEFTDLVRSKGLRKALDLRDARYGTLDDTK